MLARFVGQWNFDWGWLSPLSSQSLRARRLAARVLFASRKEIEVDVLQRQALCASCPYFPVGAYGREGRHEFSTLTGTPGGGTLHWREECPIAGKDFCKSGGSEYESSCKAGDDMRLVSVHLIVRLPF